MLDVRNIRIYADGLNGTDGDGAFQPAADSLIPSTIMQFSTAAATLDINPNVVLDDRRRPRL